MSNYTTLTIDRLKLWGVDESGEMQVSSESIYDDPEINHYIDKESAIEIIEHLKRQFEL